MATTGTSAAQGGATPADITAPSAPATSSATAGTESAGATPDAATPTVSNNGAPSTAGGAGSDRIDSADRDAAGRSPAIDRYASGPGLDPDLAGRGRAPSFDVVRVDPAGALVMAGRAASGSEVTVTSNGEVIGTGTADENGEWVILPSNPIPTGNHELGLSAKLPDGRSVDADKEVMLAVPETGKNVAGETTPTTGGSLAVWSPKDNSGGAVVLQQPAGRSARGYADRPPPGRNPTASPTGPSSSTRSTMTTKAK